MTGGGAKVDFYQDILRKQASLKSPVSISLVEMGMPPRLSADGVDRADYPRLSVAYGLSFDAFDVGEVIATGDIEGVSTPTEPEMGPVVAYIGKEQM